jgi:hypothetical protein
VPANADIQEVPLGPQVSAYAGMTSSASLNAPVTAAESRGSQLPARSFLSIADFFPEIGISLGD